MPSTSFPGSSGRSVEAPPKIKHLMGTGLQISSITMAAFYAILLFIWKLTFPDFAAPAAVEVMIWASAIIRIAVCLLPQNN